MALPADPLTGALVKITHLVPSLHPGGPEIGLVDLATAAPRAGLDISVVALASTSDTAQVSALRRLGVPVVELGLAPLDPRAVPRTAKALRDQGAQLVHSHLGHADVVAAAAAMRNRIPAVSTLHNVKNDLADGGDRVRRTARIVARQRFVKRTIAISRVQQDWYRGLRAAVDTVLVPDGVVDPGPVDLAERNRRREALGVDDREVLAVCTNPMRRDEGLELLLDACEALPDELPLVVALCGDGPMRPYLESRVDDTDELDGRVRFAHRHTDHASLLNAADLVVYPAEYGAAPTVLLRAMAAGLPVVSTQVGGIPEIVGPTTGVLVPQDARRMADALVALTEDAERRARLGAAARARFLAGHEAVGWAERLAAVYASVLTPTST
ncbi:glycosyltransferase [Pseudonocardia lacus]|uniref:glycosyltransferase n=1 Tax=Pseudonocardia lacus TaxID=2835865 RepID=UPI0020287147|nr:glycosyltransferase [Pseudonocardia lacus]